MTPGTFVHPTAEIGSGAIIGDGCRIWQHCIVLPGARLGANVTLAHNVFVEGGAVVGNGVKVKDNVSIFAGVTIEDDVFVGPAAIFTNVINPRAFVSRKDEFRATLIRTGATIGAGAVILCGTSIGRYAMIGAGAVVTRNIPDHALVTGSPAQRIGWVSRDGLKLDERLVCPKTGVRHRREGDGLIAIEG